MRRNPFLFSFVFLFPVFFSLCPFGPTVWAEDSLLKIQVLPDQNSVKVGMMFLVHVQVTNSSSDTSVEFWSNSCSYEKHWVTDNAEVLIQSWTCNENTLEQITLDPGDVYEKNIILYIPNKDKTEPVTFRLGFQRMSEDGDIAEPLWSDPITMDVVVPEEMKEAASLPDESAVSQTPDQASTMPVETNDTPPTAMSDSAVSTGIQPLVFRDPGVPIKVPPGEEFSIVLGSNPSTGFLWKMTLPEEQRTVKLLGSDHVTSQEVMPGVPGEDVYRFKAMIPGETKADFVYKRPWETKTAPTRKIFTILVQEN
ncbi:MAG: protease inhibitor I42 family protein [Candidatus Omnitrophota bacterium]